jgi:hypothetical protein
MKKFLSALFFIGFIQINSFSQIATIQAIIDSVNIDSLIFRTEEIVGDRGVTLYWTDTATHSVTDTIDSRNKNRPGNALCFKYIRDKFQSYGLQVDSASFGTTGKNIWAVLPGALYPNEPVIICAHYDGMPNVADAPAADDNGSGTAAVLEAARVITQGGYQFEHTIIFAIWDEEEYGLAGSNNFAAAADAANDTIHGVINMDAIAHDSDNDSIARVHTKPTANSEIIADTVVAVNIDYNIGIDLQVNNPGATYSDHASFWNHNYGAVLMIQDWDNDANPNYHTINDKVMYFNVPYFHKLARLSIGATAAFAVPYIPPVGAGIEEEMLESIKIYPNPSQSIVNVKWLQEYKTVQVVDMLGKIVYSNIIADNTKSISLDVNGFDNGIYFIKLVNGNTELVKKFIKN